jgi:oligoribonuclease
MKLLWIDCEMTGLDIKKDKILELAAILTDINLNTIYENEWQFKSTEKILSKMSLECKKMHTWSGLCNSAKKSRTKYICAESELMNVFQKETKKNEVFLAGNSVHYDKAFIEKHMPKITGWMHYRILDVSSLKILYFMKYKKKTPFKKKKNHRALNDIKETIEEFKFYKEKFKI